MLDLGTCGFRSCKGIEFRRPRRATTDTREFATRFLRLTVIGMSVAENSTEARTGEPGGRSRSAFHEQADPICRACLPSSGSSGFGPPTLADPEHRVIGQASPRQFDRRFAHPAQGKLPQPDLLFDPGVGKLRN